MPVLTIPGHGELRTSHGGILLGAAAIAQPAPPAGTLPSGIASLASWWDAGVRPSSGTAIASISAKVGATALSLSTAAAWVPRLAAGLGGVGLRRTNRDGYGLPNWAPVLHPILDNTLGLSAPATFGAGGAITLDLVWTRPNLRQDLVDAHLDANAYMGGTFIGGTSALIAFGGTLMLGMTNTGASDTLTLFPSGAPVALTSTLEPRHTHAVRLRGSHAAGWDVFLDGVRLTASPVPSQLPAAPATASIAMLAGAQCWFHEAFCYPRALTDAECAALDGYLARWPRGPRKGAILMLTSQSNGINTHSGTNNLQDLCAGVSYMTGLASFTILAQLVNLNKPTASGGHGLIGDATNYLQAAITTDPSTVQLGATGPGTFMQAMIRALPPYLQADVCGLWALYSENDTGFNWLQRTAFAAMVKRFIALARTFPQAGPTRDASNFMVAWNSDIPFQQGEGHASHKAAIQAVVDDPTQGAMLWLLNGTAAIQNGGTFDPATGITSGGDSSHLDIGADDARHALFGLEPLSRKLASIGRAENAIPAGALARGGPQVSGIAWEGGAVSGNAATPTALITVQHDGGTDLQVPLLAKAGLGWVLLDGGVPGTSPTVTATACVRVSATTLRVTFASAPTQAMANVTLYYIYEIDSAPFYNNPGRLGRGNAVTDNYSDMTALPGPAGFDIGTDLGAQYRVDRPLAATMLGLSIPYALTVAAPLGAMIQVGPTRTYATLHAAVAAGAVTSGSTVTLDAGTYSDVTALIGVPNVTITSVAGVAGAVMFDNAGAGGLAGGGKAILVVSNCPGFQAIGLSFANAGVQGAAGVVAQGQGAGNQAGIRFEGLTAPAAAAVRHCSFDGCVTGIFAPDANLDLTLDTCDFGYVKSNGQSQDGYSHDAYLACRSLTVAATNWYGNAYANNCKSRSATNTFSGGYNANNAGRCIDLPDAGAYSIAGGIYVGSGISSENIFAYGEESLGKGAQGGTITGATIRVMGGSGSTVWNNAAGTAMAFSGTVQQWFGTGTVSLGITGPGAVTGLASSGAATAATLPAAPAPVSGIAARSTTPVPGPTSGAALEALAVPLTLMGAGGPAGTTTTFGQAFLPGHVPVGSSVVVKRTDGSLLPSQFDIIKPGPDGTPAHAVLHVAAPALAAGVNEVCTLAIGTPPAGTVINLAAALAGRAASVTITPTGGGSPWTCDLIANLPASRWWSGPLASQARIALPIPAAAVGGVTSARLLADLTLTADGVLGVSLAVRNDACLRDNGGAGYSSSTASSIAFRTPISATQDPAALAVDSFQLNGGTVNYANGSPATLTNPVITTYGQTATITYQTSGPVTVTGYPYVLMRVRGGTAAYGITLTGDGVVQMSYPGISAPLYTAFLRERRWKADGTAAPARPRVHHDLTYLARVGVVASYDQPLSYNGNFIGQYVSLLADPGWDTPYAGRGLSPDMGATGGRPDIGFTTECNVGWLMTGDDTLRQVAVGQAEASGVIPWHAWSPDSGAWVNQVDHPDVWAMDGGQRGFFFPYSYGSPFSLDGAHQPDASFLPALLTGRRAFLDNVCAQASFSVMGRYPDPRGHAADGSWTAAGQASRIVEIRNSGAGVLFALQDQMRGQSWCLRQLTEAAWIAPATEQPHGSFYQDVTEAQLRYWANDIPAANVAQGQTAGSIRQWDYGSDNGALATWQHHYIVSMLVRAARLGMAHAQDVLLWTNNWTTGCFLSSPDMLAEDGIAYNLPRGAISSGHQASYPFFTTWAQIGAAFAAHAGNSSGSYGVGFSNVTTQDIQTDYGQSASATLALIHDYLADFGLDHARVDAALAVVNGFSPIKTETQSSNFMDSPKWSVTPRGVTRKI